MEVDTKQHFKCWGCPSSEVIPVKTVFHSSNGYYGYLPKNLSSEPINSTDAEKAVRCILAGRKRTYNEMCSGVNYGAFNNHKSCKYKMNKVEESNTYMVLG